MRPDHGSSVTEGRGKRGAGTATVEDMRALLRPCLCLLLLLPLQADTQRFRQWLAGREAGGLTVTQERRGAVETVERREWVRLERLGRTVEQRVDQRSERLADGSLRFSWSVLLASQPMEGQATWNPADPGRLHLQVQGAPARAVELPEGALLWPGDLEARTREAARLRRDLHLRTYSFPLQQWTELELKVQGPDPLPGFPDAVRFRGLSREGSSRMELTSWISPREGEVRQAGELMGIATLLQRAELPAPRSSAGPDLFARTLHPLPPHPFLPWVDAAVLTWTGRGAQELPEDTQQRRLAPGRYAVRRAALPSAEEAAQPPVSGRPGPEEAPFLAESPLVPFRDPVFDGLVARLQPRAGASRWELARAVCTFVFDWIARKDYTVGFAGAREVARDAAGDCTEHGVLAVALLRRLGVPARGVTGWVGLEDTFGLHFWVEVRLLDRWVPLDPTFDQAPASALRLKLGTTELSDLGSVGWDTAVGVLAGGRWVPEAPWPAGLALEGDRVRFPAAELLLPRGVWRLQPARLRREDGLALRAVTRPGTDQLAGARLLQDAPSGRRGWWIAASRTLYAEVAPGAWLELTGLDEAGAFEALARLELRRRSA